MKKTISILLIFAVLFSTIGTLSITGAAKTPIKQGKVFDDWDDWDDEDYAFKLNKPSVIYITLRLAIDYDAIGHTYDKLLNGKNGVRMTLERNTYYDFEDDWDDWDDLDDNRDTDDLDFDEFDDLDTQEEAYCAIEDFKIGKGYIEQSFWFYTDEVLPEGYYDLSFESLTDNVVSEAMSGSYKVYAYSGFTENTSLPKSAALKVEETKKITLSDLKDTLADTKWTLSDKTVAKFTVVYPNSVTVKGLKKGVCTLKAKLENGKEYTCQIKVNNCSPKLNATKLNIPYGSAKQLSLKYTKAKIKWSTSNKKIAVVNSKGKVTAKATGNCVIAAKCGGKTYKCNVKVYKMWTDFTAALTGYSTRDNYFTVKIKNYGTRSMKIYNKGAYCMDANYKSFDRKLRLPKNKDIILKPGESKNVKFIVKGSTTWWNYHDFTVRYYFYYNGQKYLGSVWDEDSAFKRGKSWYNTYQYSVDEAHLLGYDWM